MRKQLEEEIRKENGKEVEVENFKEEFERLKQINVQHYAEATGFQSMFERVEHLNAKKEMYEENRESMLAGMTEMSGELLRAQRFHRLMQYRGD